MLKIIRNKKMEYLVDNFSSKFYEIISTIKKDKIIVGLCGGNSVVSFYEKISKLKLDTNKIEFYLIDERINDNSNYELVSKYFKIYKYDEKLYSNITYFDLIILSSGEDSHIASLFPNHESILNDSISYIHVRNSPKPPFNRVSASKNLLLKSLNSILLIIGESKKQAYFDFIESDSVIKTPSLIVKQIPSTYVYTDN